MAYLSILGLTCVALDIVSNAAANLSPTSNRVLTITVSDARPGRKMCRLREYSNVSPPVLSYYDTVNLMHRHM